MVRIGEVRFVKGVEGSKPIPLLLARRVETDI